MKNEILDNAISRNRILWTMDDESFNRLLCITQAHLRLVKEHSHIVVSERRQAIIIEIERLRVERECLLESFLQEGMT